MPQKRTLERAQRANREGKSPSTQAGEFVREEIHHIRQGRHGARSAKQVIAIGLSKARRAGVKLKPPAKGRTSVKTYWRAQSDYRRGQLGLITKASQKRSRATLQVLHHESRKAASPEALARQARLSASRRSAAARSASAKKAAETRNARK
jgi:hypothetical protein